MSRSIFTAETVLMVRPASFGFNPETAASNSFQNDLDSIDVLNVVLAEFDHVVNQLREAEIDVLVFHANDLTTPDAIFPNNWISTHPEGLIVLYPLLAENRRRERNLKVIDLLKSTFDVLEVFELSKYEIESLFLEGTGSVVFDHQHKIAYAVRSPRTDEKVLIKLCEKLNYEPFLFTCLDNSGGPVYHTNVVMHVAEHYVVICGDGIKDHSERLALEERIRKTGKAVIFISGEQMNSFCGNMLQLRNRKGELLTICSATAMNNLTNDQKALISTHSHFVVVDIPMIEKIGGGGVRCLLAEVFLRRTEKEDATGGTKRN